MSAVLADHSGSLAHEIVNAQVRRPSRGHPLQSPARHTEGIETR
jgi:hypothetical protein